MDKATKRTLVIFSVFMVEAIIHYNTGKNDCENSETTEGFLPPLHALFRLAILVSLLSVLSGIIIGKVVK